MWLRNREGGHLGIHLFVFIMEEDDNNDEDDESSRCPGNSWEWGGVRGHDMTHRSVLIIYDQQFFIA